MITGDLNIVDVQTVVQYNIEDLDAFGANVADPEGCPDRRTLRDAAQAALSEVVGQYSLDDVLVSKRDGIGRATAEILQGILDSYEAGINIMDLLLVDVKPPKEVRDAFHDVHQARSDRDSMINQAQIQSSDVVPLAGLEAEQIIKTAEADLGVRIIQAERDAGRFVSVLRAYEQEEAQAFKLLHLETLDRILPGIGKFIGAAEPAAQRPAGPNFGGIFRPSGAFELRPAQQGAFVSSDGDVSVNFTLTTGIRSLSSQTSLDDRLHLVDPPPVVIPDKEKQNLVVDSYARYRIVAPVQFREALHNEFFARAELSKIIISVLRAEFARRDRFEIIGAEFILDRNGFPVFDEDGKLTVRGTNTRSDIMSLVLAEVQRIVADQNFGIKVVDVRMKRVSFPDSTASVIYTRMRAERSLIARRIRVQAEVVVADIQGEADKDRTIILAEARRLADEISAEAEAQAIDIFIQALVQVPELSRYQKSLEAYKVSGIRGR